MIEERSPKSKTRLVAVVAAALAIGIGAGVGIGYGVSGSDDSLEVTVAAQQRQLAEAQERLDATERQVQELAAEKTTLEAATERLRERTDGLEAELAARIDEVSSLQEEIAELLDKPANLDVEDLKQLQEQLEADRLLLVDIRKGTPDDRAEATRTWANIRKVAGKSDPSLVPKVDTVTRALPTYFDWFERDFASFQEQQLSYLLTGANQYPASVEDFQNSFLSVLIDRIDRIVNLTR